MKKLLLIGIFCCSVLFTYGVPAQTQPAKSSPDRDNVTMVIQVVGNRISIQNAVPNSIVEIYSVLGVKLKQYRLPQADEEYVIELPKGCYILKSDNTVRKIAIK